MEMVLCSSMDGTNCARGKGFNSSVYQMAHCFIIGKCSNTCFYGFNALMLLHLALRGPVSVKKNLNPLIILDIARSLCSVNAEVGT